VGVVISYNSQAPTITGSATIPLPVNPFTFLRYPEPALAINPLNWSADTTNIVPASASENTESYSYDCASLGVSCALNPLSPAADATLLKDPMSRSWSVAVSKYTQGAGSSWPTGVFHGNDYAFFFGSLKQNLASRVAAWKK
jgi:hypothetical protein